MALNFLFKFYLKMRGLGIHVNIHLLLLLLLLLLLFGTQKVLDHLVGFLSSRKTISRLGINPPITPFGLGTSPLSSSRLGSRTEYSSLWIVFYGIFLTFSLNVMVVIKWITHKIWNEFPCITLKLLINNTYIKNGFIPFSVIYKFTKYNI